MDVWPEDVKRYGPSAAIVLSDLRAIGATSSEPVLVSPTETGGRCGLSRKAVSRALRTLVRTRAVRVERYKLARRSVLRMAPCGGVRGDATESPQDATSQVSAGCVSETDPIRHTPPRLDSVRALLDAVG